MFVYFNLLNSNEFFLYTNKSYNTSRTNNNYNKSLK